MTIYRSDVALGPVPDKGIYDLLFGDVSFDDGNVVFKECKRNGKSITYACAAALFDRTLRIDSCFSSLANVRQDG